MPEIAPPSWSRARVLPQILVGVAGSAAFHLATDSVLALVLLGGQLVLWWLFFRNLYRANHLHRLMQEAGETLEAQGEDTGAEPMGANYPYWWLFPSLVFALASLWPTARPLAALLLWLDLFRVVFNLLAVSTARAGLEHRIHLIEDPEYLARFVDMEKFEALNEEARRARTDPSKDSQETVPTTDETT